MRLHRAGLVVLLACAGCGGSGDDDIGGGEGEGERLCGPDGVVRGDDVIVESQAEVQALEGCTEIEGALQVRGPDVIDLGPLSSLVRIGMLDVAEASSLRSLAGLESLGAVGWIEIEGNDSLQTLEGLGPARVAHGISIRANPRLATLRGLAGLGLGEGYEGSFAIDVLASPLLSSLEGLEIIHAAEAPAAIVLAECDSLADIDALAGVELFANVQLRALPAVESLDALSSLASADWIAIEGLPIRTLAGLSGLREVGALHLTNNLELTDLSALSDLQILHELALSGNAALESCDLALPFVDVVSIWDSPSLTSLGAGPLGSGEINRLFLRDAPALANLDALSEITAVAVDMTLAELDAIDSLAPLDGIAEVERSLAIYRNERLPQQDAEEWAATRGAREVKVDGNLGAEPHTDDCPWTNDIVCDEDLEGGTGLCPDGTDDAGCRAEE